MTSKVDETRQVASSIQANESIVLLKKPQLEGVGTEENSSTASRKASAASSFIPRTARNRRPRRRPVAVQFKIYGEQEFTDALFPWFEPSTAPPTRRASRCCSRGPASPSASPRSACATSSGWMADTKKTGGGGSVACAAGPGGPAASASAGGRSNRPTWLRSGTYSGERDRIRQRGRHRHLGADRRRRADSRSSRPSRARPATGCPNSCARSCSAPTWRGSRPRRLSAQVASIEPPGSPAAPSG